MSDLYALTLGIVLASGTAAAWLTNRSLALTVVLHNAAWACGLLIVGSGLMNYRALSPGAWITISGAIAAFNLGVWTMAGGRRTGREIPPCRQTSHAPVPAGSLVPLPLYWALFCLFNVGFAIYLWTIARHYGLTTLLTNPVAIRGNREVNYLEAFPVYGKTLFYLAPLCFVLTAFPGLVKGLPRLPAALRYLVLLWLIVAQVATLQRTNVFATLLWALGVYLLARASGSVDLGVRFQARHVVAVLLAGVIVFQGVAVLLGKTGTTNPLVRYSVSEHLRDSSLTGVMHYIGGGIPAFGILLESQNDVWPRADHTGNLYGDYNPQTWGAATLAAPLQFVPGAPHWREIAANVRLPAPTNVYTWLEPWYRDFRLEGALVGSFVVGLLCGTFARRRRLSPARLLTGGLVIGLTGLATFSNRLTSTTVLVLLLAIGGLHLIVRWSGRNAGEGDAFLTTTGSARPGA